MDHLGLKGKVGRFAHRSWHTRSWNQKMEKTIRRCRHECRIVEKHSKNYFDL